MSAIAMRITTLATILALSAGCAGRPASTSALADRNVITADVIQQRGFHTAYEAVEALHAPWLVDRPDGLATPSEVLVYIDNSRLGGTATLRQVPAANIASIRFIDAGTAITRWGVDHGKGVIMVATKKEQR
jgi:hypothetical protein